MVNLTVKLGYSALLLWRCRGVDGAPRWRCWSELLSMSGVSVEVPPCLGAVAVVERSMVELRGSAGALWRWRGRRAEVALLVGTLMAEA